jgi:hypothetical protein
MADERSVFPGDTPRTPGRWLDRETAERLLRGESLESVDMAARDQAERLAKTLDALSVEAAPTSAELPGEAAALAAFREARADRVDDWVGERAGERIGERIGERAVLGHRVRARSTDAGLVRIGGPDRGGPRPRPGRAVRLGLAAALAVGMVGGVAAAAGTGVLPTPFGKAEPDPAASVSAAATPNRPLVSPSSGAPKVEPSPDGATGGSGQGPSRDTARKGSSPDTGRGTSSDDRSGRPGDTWSGALSACRDVRDGKGLTADRRRSLEGAAGGSSHVKKYCKGVLAGTGSADNDVKSGTQSGTQSGTESGTQSGTDSGTKKDDKADAGETNGDGNNADDGNGGSSGNGSQDKGGAGSGNQGGRDGNGAAAPRLAPGGNSHASNGGAGTPASASSLPQHAS